MRVEFSSSLSRTAELQVAANRSHVQSFLKQQKGIFRWQDIYFYIALAWFQAGSYHHLPKFCVRVSPLNNCKSVNDKCQVYELNVYLSCIIWKIYVDFLRGTIIGAGLCSSCFDNRDVPHVTKRDYQLSITLLNERRECIFFIGKFAHLTWAQNLSDILTTLQERQSDFSQKYLKYYETLF